MHNAPARHDPWRAGDAFPSAIKAIFRENLERNIFVRMRTCDGATALMLVAALFSMAPALADGSGDPTAAKSEDGKYYDKQGIPTYKIQPDAPVAYYSYSWFIQSHSECHVCDAPYGMGSSSAPALVDSLKTMSYGDFRGFVAGGRKNVNTANENVMPAFGTNK